MIVRRAQYELDKALEREHILDGLEDRRRQLDEVIKVIRKAEDTPKASAQLQKRFKLSERQAEAILNMRLAKLTGLEIEKLEVELKEVRGIIEDLRASLESKPKRLKLMKDELQKITDTYGDARRTEITSDQGEFTIEDLIAQEDMVVTIRTPATSSARRSRRIGASAAAGAARAVRTSRSWTSSSGSSSAARTITC